MISFFSELDKVVNIIESNPLLEIEEYSKNQGINKRTIRELEDHLGLTIPKSIKSFFLLSNGLKFQWRFKEGIDEDFIDQLIDDTEDYDIEYPDDEDNPFAKINFLPLEDSLQHVKWVKELAFDISSKKEIHVLGRTYTAESFFQKMKPIDLYSEFSCMAFFMQEGGDSAPMFFLTDHYISWKHARITDFDSYLNLILATYGVTESREKYLEEFDGYRKPTIHWGEILSESEDLTPSFLRR